MRFAELQALLLSGCISTVPSNGSQFRRVHFGYCDTINLPILFI